VRGTAIAGFERLAAEVMTVAGSGGGRTPLAGVGLVLGAACGGIIGLLIAGATGIALGTVFGASVGLIFGAAVAALRHRRMP
jgi:hypothetical protein